MYGPKFIMRDMNILIAGGGTGGHLFPALAIGEEILSRNSNIKIHYVGSAFGLDGYFRVSYATSMEKLKVAMDRIKSFCESLS